MRYALRGLLTKAALPVEVDYVLCAPCPRTENVEHREGGGDARRLPHDIPAHTVSLACVSASGDLPGGREDIVSDSA